MSDTSRSNMEEMARQAKQHIASLRAAGVEWLPRGALPFPAPEGEPAVETDVTPTRRADAAPLASSVEAFAETVKHQLDNTNSPDTRKVALKVLSETVSKCTRCAELASTRTQTVFGVGPLDPDLCFIGEAPGADEDAQGEPFVGAAGQLLNRIIVGCGLKREEVYICNIIKCRPPGNRTPLASEAANCREYLEKQLDLVKPKFICCLGSTAIQHLLGTTNSIGKMRKRFHDYRGIPVICTYHPAYLLPHRNPNAKKDVWEDMKMLLTRMGRPIPDVKK